MPRLGDLFGTDGSSSAKNYTTLNFASGFWQIHLDPKAQNFFHCTSRNFSILEINLDDILIQWNLSTLNTHGK